ncbi:uncharacterized protein LOC133815287 [Humulus lupulus]|uniref:uncharacterized protein LOC133815287 n=1 Tax=Humulus lupulus TaxID=3486 RepID=UPI002B40B7DF|nr:uncharacterized protein LOC133815287 [Humulus lupulus]
MAPYEMIHGQKYKSPLHWDEVGERQNLGSEVSTEASEAVENIRKRMLTAQSRQKSYADPKQRDIEFIVGDHVFLRVLPMKGVMRFGKKGKISSRFIGSFEILDRVGSVAYRLTLLLALSETHNIFHIFMFQKYVSDPSHVLNYELLELRQDLCYGEQPMIILEKGNKELRFKKIPLVEVLWKSLAREASWELEEYMRKQYPELFGESNF